MASDLKSKAYQYVREKILTEQWPEGRYLSMVQVAKSVDMSYTPVREAIIQLESEGMVEKIPRVGVRPRRVDREEVKRFFEMRLYMESACSELAIERITVEEIRLLEGNLQEHKKTLERIKDAWQKKAQENRHIYYMDGPEAVTLHQLNTEFHGTLMKSSRNPYMMEIVDKMNMMTRVLRIRAMLPGTSYTDQLELDYRYHTQIFQALAQRDPAEAVKWTRKHVSDAGEYHLKVYDWLKAVNQLGSFKI